MGKGIPYYQMLATVLATAFFVMGEISESVDFIGRGERILTSDHLNPIQVRYQAALRPVEGSNHTGTNLRSETCAGPLPPKRRRRGCSAFQNVEHVFQLDPELADDLLTLIDIHLGFFPR